jgi:cellulose synthase/poly-beta-1,6-N-acetylglucosamine synthase-like glycosyltransferase
MPDRENLKISVLVPTYNRAALLDESLASLEQQTLARDAFEVLVIDDGSTDDTGAVCRRRQGQLPLRYFRIGHSGISSAKSLGVFLASARLVLFFDDDDVAHADLLRQHVNAHQRYPDESAAVLGYTTWAPWMRISEVMHYVTNVGQLLFSYPGIRPGRPLDFTHFWGGRSSCKRSLLARHGVFRQEFGFILEDIELGYRLKQFGLNVFYHPDAISFMNRPLTLEAFCQRCERQGRAAFMFARLHRDQAVDDYCRTIDADRHWEAAKARLPEAIAQATRIERYLDGGADDADLRTELHGLYKFVFDAYKYKGVVEAATEAAGS